MGEAIGVSTIITILLAMLGACLGSFVNVAALRYTKRLSFTTGRSCCPVCNRTLQWYELVPVISWLILLGRCRTCNARISPRYILVELTTALISVLCFVNYGLSWMALIAFGVAVLLLAVALIDMDTMEIPNGLVIALIPLAVLVVWVQPETALLSRGIGFLAVSLPMLLITMIIDGAFGGGDIKLMAVCGFLLGWQNTLLAFFIAVMLAGSISFWLILRKKAKTGNHIAFGPYLCLGVVTSLLYGREIILWYLNLSGM